MFSVSLIYHTTNMTAFQSCSLRLFVFFLNGLSSIWWLLLLLLKYYIEAPYYILCIKLFEILFDKKKFKFFLSAVVWMD